MASHSTKPILATLTLILTITVPISTADGRRSSNCGDTEQHLRDLCSKTNKPDVCWNILKVNLELFDKSKGGDVVVGVIDLALDKALDIEDQLNQWYEESNDAGMREKYRSCSMNYDEASGYLTDAYDLDANDYQRISEWVDRAGEESEKCRRVFGSGSKDPGHVGDRNNEFGLYLDIVRAATGRLK